MMKKEKLSSKIWAKLNKERLNILLVGGGGREHAIAKALAGSRACGRLIAAPGNAGIEEFAEIYPIQATDLQGQLELALDQDIDLVFVAPDDPLAMGLTDLLWAHGIPAFGPSADAARIESSKYFAKSLMARANVPTAKYSRFTEPQAALNCLADHAYPLVVKADGLALGKGVIICQNQDEAETAIKEMMQDQVFGAAGKEILIEEFLSGPELTVLAITDGKNYKLLPSARDHKRAFDHDQGPNTGGMGAIAPVPEWNEDLETRIKQEVIEPILDAMERSGYPFKGVLYCGLMLTEDGPKVIEFNARFGDPEAQAVIPLIKSDFLDLILAVVKEELDQYQLELSTDSSAVVVMASGGYPGSYCKLKPIDGLSAEDSDQVYIYHSGTTRSESEFLTNGGRVLAVSAQGADLDQALARAYARIQSIKFEGGFYRTDIGRT